MRLIFFHKINLATKLHIKSWSISQLLEKLKISIKKYNNTCLR